VPGSKVRTDKEQEFGDGNFIGNHGPVEQLVSAPAPTLGRFFVNSRGCVFHGAFGCT